MRTYDAICFSVVILLALAGVIFLTTIAHELSHKQDFKGLVNNDSICLFNMPNSPMDLYGSYTFYHNKSVSSQIAAIDKHTELKAYAISIFLSLLFGLAISNIIYIFLHLKEGVKDDIEKD